jgi:pimeloyl-ACP methyl ester carboxylesterase
MLVEVDGYKIHVYAEGDKGNKPTLVFMSGSGTVAPVYDFKSLYSLLSDEYRIVVVEKAGYGYSDIYEIERDIDTMLEEVRQGLSLAGEKGPYVLFPHSMSGLEAIYWAQKYPEELKAIIGLDMSVPESYDYFNFSSINQMIYVGRASVLLGLHRIPGVYSLDNTSLNATEIEQQKLLMYRNAVNINHISEGKAVYNNAAVVKSGGDLSLPILMFVSDGMEIGEFWIPSQKRFAAKNDAQLIQLDCGHYVHNFMPKYIAEKAMEYLSKLH